MTPDDPVVARVRAARRRILAACDGDSAKIFEWAKQREAALGERVVGLVRQRAERKDRPPADQYDKP